MRWKRRINLKFKFFVWFKRQWRWRHKVNNNADQEKLRSLPSALHWHPFARSVRIRLCEYMSLSLCVCVFRMCHKLQNKYVLCCAATATAPTTTTNTTSSNSYNNNCCSLRKRKLQSANTWLYEAVRRGGVPQRAAGGRMWTENLEVRQLQQTEHTGNTDRQEGLNQKRW